MEDKILDFRFVVMGGVVIIIGELFLIDVTRLRISICICMKDNRFLRLASP